MNYPLLSIGWAMATMDTAEDLLTVPLELDADSHRAKRPKLEHLPSSSSSLSPPLPSSEQLPQPSSPPSPPLLPSTTIPEKATDRLYNHKQVTSPTRTADDANALTPPRASSSSYQHDADPSAFPTLSPSLADFFANLDPLDLDFLPSSDPASNSQSLHLLSHPPLVKNGQSLIAAAQEVDGDADGEEVELDGDGGLCSPLQPLTLPVPQHEVRRDDEEEEEVDYYDLHPEEEQRAPLDFDAGGFGGFGGVFSAGGDGGGGGFPVFIKGNGKKVELSSAALERAKALFAEPAEGAGEAAPSGGMAAPVGQESVAGGFARPTPALPISTPRTAPPAKAGFVGFSSARGSAMKGPSAASLAAAQALLNSPPSSQLSTAVVNNNPPLPGLHLPPPSLPPIRLSSTRPSFTTSSSSQTPSKVPAPPTLLPLEPPPSRAASTAGFGFASASGRTIAGPSQAALQRARALLESAETGDVGPPPPPASSTVRIPASLSSHAQGVVSTSLLSSSSSSQGAAEELDDIGEMGPSLLGGGGGTGIGRTASGRDLVAPPTSSPVLSPPAAAIVGDLLSDDPGPHEGGAGEGRKESEDVFGSKMVKAGTALGVMGESRAVLGLKDANGGKGRGRGASPALGGLSRGLADTSTTTVPARPALNSASTHPRSPIRSIVQTLPSTLPRSTPSTSARAPLPFRSPMLSRPSTSQIPSAALGSPLAGPSSSTRFSTPARPTSGPMRRLNVSMSTPRPRPPAGSSGGLKFSTPFKGGKRPEGLTPMGLRSAVRESVRGGAKGKGKEVSVGGDGDGVQRKEYERVFDLSDDGTRLSLKESGLRPQTHYIEYLETVVGLPRDLLAMDSTTSLTFTFPCGRGTDAAFSALQATGGCDLVTLKWVRNHWALIVWKLASQVRSNPDLMEKEWTWEGALKQLKYRYEREINLAQRSSIKRIQEHDSAAGLPLILCVSQIRWGEDDSARGDEDRNCDAPLVIVGMELTDGWYRVRANVDRTLKRACERGKVVVGTKLAICGARLIISGNSTSLAPWHAKLGFTNRTFVASLDSLTPTGGAAPLIDVTLVRVYPCGYMDLKNPQETWNESEEHERADQWKRGREKAEARLADHHEGFPGEWDLIYELLEEAKYGSVPPAGEPSCDSSEEEPDEVLDRLHATEGRAAKKAIIRHLSRRQVHGCAQLAAEYLERDRQEIMSNLQSDLQGAFPPRNVRSFRAMRVVNAQAGQKESKRSALLTVWDAAEYSPDFFVAGKRYRVTNVVPKGTWSRSSLEIGLATRRDSRWYNVEVN